MTARSPKKPRRSGDLSIIPSVAVFDEQLGPADLRLLCALGAFADRHGKCWPATTTLAKELRISDRRVRACLRKLEGCGYVQTEHRPGQRSVYLIVRKLVDPGTLASGVDPGTSASGVGANPGTPASAPPEHQHPGTPEHQHPPNGVTNVTKNDYTVRFEEFWQAYPPRRPHSNPKKTARAKFEAALKRGVEPAVIIRGAENYAAYVQRERPDSKFVAQAQTWLDQERWKEYQEAAEAERPPLML